MAGGLVATSMARSLLMPALDESPTALLARPWLRVPPAGDAAVMEETLDMFLEYKKNKETKKNKTLISQPESQSHGTGTQ